MSMNVALLVLVLIASAFLWVVNRPLGVPVDPTIIRRWFPVVRRPDGDLDLGTVWRLTTAPRRRAGQMQRNKFHFLNSHLLSIYLYIYIKKDNLKLHPPMFLLIFQVQPSHFTQIINVTQSQIRVSTLVEGSQGRGKSLPGVWPPLICLHWKRSVSDRHARRNALRKLQTSSHFAMHRRYSAPISEMENSEQGDTA